MAATTSMEGRAGGGAAAAAAEWVLDEFTAPTEKSGFLERSRGCIERLFRVRLAVLWALDGGGGGGGAGAPLAGLERHLPTGHRIWLSLFGEREAVRRAKEYIKGLCEPELEEREYYPKDMHCIFVGSQSLFLNCLIFGTCADIVVSEMGVLSIKGSTEPVVMAQSHVQQLVTLFRNNENLPNGQESEVKKQFKRLVEAHADKYTMDLLILPSSLKKELLYLAQNEDDKTKDKVMNPTLLDRVPEVFLSEMQKQTTRNSECRTAHEEARNSAGTPVTELAKQMDSVFPDASGQHFVPINGQLETFAGKERQSCKRRSSDAEERLPKKQFSFESNQESQRTSSVVIDLCSDESNESDYPSVSTKDDDEISEETEYKILVNFFKSMGYSQQIVEKVIGDQGQSAEPLLLLEEIVKESKKMESREKEQDTLVAQVVEEEGSSSNKGCHVLDRKFEAPKNAKQNVGSQAQCKIESKPLVSNSENKTAVAFDKAPQYRKIFLNNSSEPSHISQISGLESDGHVNACGIAQGLMEDRKAQELNLVARGSSGTPHLPIQKESVTLHTNAEQSPMKRDQHGLHYPLQIGAGQLPSQKASSPEHHLLDCAPSPQFGAYSERRTGGGGFYSHHSDPSVTGIQRFLESLKTPYKLELKNEPGGAYLKHIIIDGSNVAMLHGLKKFFSCRGIAIAVGHFWKRGHRNITVFVPQWRTRRDPSVTEQHFLTQLQDVGILALTPARIVLGARIASHDDRFLLHLAEKTGGVIVTNDNLREFVDESPSWREIIQRRLLQYTFVGDIFMVPDDPLGRNGPALERFLQDEALFRGVPPQFGHTSRGLPPRASHLPNGNEQVMNHNLCGPLPNLPLCPSPPPRSSGETIQLKEALKKIFPTSEQREKIEEILAQHPHMRDMNALSAMVLDLG